MFEGFRLDMDNLGDIINKLEQTMMNKSDTDLIKLEQHHREFKNELTLRKAQVEQMTKEIDAHNLTIYKLNRELEMCKCSLKETTFNFNLILHKSRSQDDQIKELNETYVRMKVKQEMMVTEIETINSHKDTLSRQNCLLERKVQDLEAQAKYQAIFQNELQERHSKFLTMMNDTKKIIPKLESEQRKIVEFQNRLNSGEESSHMNQYLSAENDRLKRENKSLESQLLKISAKCENLEKLLKKSSAETDDNLSTKLILHQWKSSSADLQQQIQNDVAIIDGLTDAINKEKATSAQLIVQNNQINEMLYTERRINAELKSENKQYKLTVEKAENELKILKGDHDKIKKEIIEIV